MFPKYHKPTKKQIVKAKSKSETLFDQCERLWFEIVKLRAGFRSEISGLSKDQGNVLTAHHVNGKSNYALRFDLRNGICLENGKEHIYGVHNSNPSISRYYDNLIREKMIEREGKDIYLKLEMMKNDMKPDLNLILIYLKQEKKKLNG